MMRLLILLFSLIFSVSYANATTYYIDFTGGADTNNGTSTATPWKYAPGMPSCANTCAGVTPADNDIFIFKGGVTWSGTGWRPWRFKGGTSAMVTYTTDHTWFTGGAFTQPTFDGGNASTAYDSNALMGNINLSVNLYTLRWFTFNDLHFTKCGPNLTQHDGVCMYFNNVHHVALTNNTIDGYCGRMCVYFHADAGTTYDTFTITGNDVSHTGSFFWMASVSSGDVFKNVWYVGNTIHDFASQLGAAGGAEGNHGDGFLHYYSVPLTDTTQFMDTFTFCNNRSYGDFTRGIGPGTGEDMTSFLFIEGTTKNTLICNNEFGFFPYQNSDGAALSIFEAVIDRYDNQNTSNGNFWVFNNSIGGDGVSNSGGASFMFNINGSGKGSVFIENNIVAAGPFCGWSQSGVTPTNIVVNDYNEYWCSNGNISWVANGTHSISSPSDPKWVSVLDHHLTSTSPGKAAGVNLSAVSGLTAAQQTLLNSDRDGCLRGTTWDMGAYNFGTCSGGSGGPSKFNIQLNLKRASYELPEELRRMFTAVSTESLVVADAGY